MKERASSADDLKRDDPERVATPRTKRLVRNVLIATLLGAFVFAALSVYGDVQALARDLSAFDWTMMLAALALASSNYALRFIRWQYYLARLDIRVPIVESAVIFLAGFVMSVTPGKVGEVFKSALLFESRGAPIARTAPVVIAERLTDLIALVILTALGSLSFDGGPLIAAGGGAIALTMLVACAFRPFGEMLLRLTERLPLVKRVAPKLREAYEALYAMTRAGALVFGTLIAVVAWGLEVAALGVILHGLGVELGVEATTFAYSASTVAGAVAMMPGGLGVTEVGMTGFVQALGGPGVTAASASAATILTRLATLWWAVLVGFVALAFFRIRYAPRGTTP